METTVVRLLSFLRSVTTAATVALALAYIAHYDFGLSRQAIRNFRLGCSRCYCCVGGRGVFRQEIAQAQLIEAMSAIVPALQEDHVSKDQCYHSDEGHQR